MLGGPIAWQRGYVLAGFLKSYLGLILGFGVLGGIRPWDLGMRPLDGPQPFDGFGTHQRSPAVLANDGKVSGLHYPARRSCEKSSRG